MEPLFRQDDRFSPLALEKFVDPDVTAKGEKRAYVPLKKLDTLWFNTGTLCNIACQSCYIESTPTNDRLVYLALSEVERFLDEIPVLQLGTREIGFTGGEPFMNAEFPAMLALALERGFEVLVLTNAMKPLLRPRVMAALQALDQASRERLTFRVSLDHFDAEYHDRERGEGSFSKAVEGMKWLVDEGFRVAVAGRMLWFEDEATAREGYGELFHKHSWPIDASDPSVLVLFPEMDEGADIAEITTECWSILGKTPESVMCSMSRMVVHRKGDDRATVLPCTLIAYDDRFAMGASLAQSLKTDGGMFTNGAVKLNHPHCARFCVLGGASCAP